MEFREEDEAQYKYRSLKKLVGKIEAAEKYNLCPYAKSTVRRHKICRSIWNGLIQKVSHSSVIVAVLLLSFKATTARTYAYTIRSLYPQETAGRMWKEALIKVCHMAACEEVSSATPATQHDMLKLLRAAQSQKEKATLLIMWLTASRFGDINCMKLTKIEKDGHSVKILVRLPIWKSDRSGKQLAAKAFAVPKKWAPHIRDAIEKPLKYSTILNIAKTASLTAHSIRKGATQFLSEKKWCEKDILTLTQHSTCWAPLQARLYMKHCHFTRTEARTQLKLSQELLDGLGSAQL